jgi:hypothetical protein
MIVRWDASTDFLIETVSVAFTFVDPDNAGKTVVDNEPQPFPRHCPADDESIVLTII